MPAPSPGLAALSPANSLNRAWAEPGSAKLSHHAGRGMRTPGPGHARRHSFGIPSNAQDFAYSP